MGLKRGGKGGRIMRTIYKHSILIMAIASVILAMLTVSAHALAFKDLTSDGVTIDDTGFVELELETSDPETIANVTSSDETVASVTRGSTWYTAIDIIPQGEGECLITVTGSAGNEINIPVKVTSGYTREHLKENSDIDTYYGYKKLEMFSLEGAKVTVKVGKDKYGTYSIGSSTEKTINLKKVYPLGTKITATFKYKGVQTSVTNKIGSRTSFDIVKSSRTSPKKLKVHCTALHKGDVIKVKYKGKVYSSPKVTKNYNFQKWAWATVKVKKKFTKSSKMTVWIVNKDKKKLYRNADVKFIKWKYDPNDWEY